MSSIVAHLNFARGFRGGERQTELLIRALAGQGWSQRLIVRRGSPLATRLHGTAGLEIVECAAPFLLSVRWLRDVGVVHAHEAKAGKPALLARLLWGKPFILTRRMDKSPKMSILNRLIYGKAAAVVGVSALVSRLLKSQFPTARVQSVLDAHSEPRADDQKVSELHLRFAGKLVIGHAGALDYYKGQTFLIEALRQLNREFPDLILCLLGEGRDEARIRDSARGLDNVVFAGFQHNIADWLSVIDIFAFPSLSEGLGSTILDAMSLGKPIVASRAGGIPEVVAGGENGLLVPPGDAAALAAALRQLILDPALRQRMGARSRELAGRYTPARMAASYAPLYQHALAQAPSAV